MKKEIRDYKNVSVSVQPNGTIDFSPSRVDIVLSDSIYKDI